MNTIKQHIPTLNYASSPRNTLPCNALLSVACSTIYKTKGLPEKGVLEQYVSIFKQVDCTGRSDIETLNYGYVQYDFDLFDTQTVEIRHFGHASLVDDDYLNNLNTLIPQKKTSKKK